jgi:cytoskeleton protein RodZ
LRFFDLPSAPPLGASGNEPNQPLFPPSSQPLPSQPGAVAMGQPSAVEPAVAASAAGIGVPPIATAALNTASASASVASGVAFVATTAASTASPAASPASATVPGAWITFSSKGESWVEATSATGAVLIRRTLSAGESASISGTPPVKVTIGQAPNTTVTVRGQAFDTAPYLRQDVARFTLN